MPLPEADISLVDRAAEARGRSRTRPAARVGIALEQLGRSSAVRAAAGSEVPTLQGKSVRVSGRGVIELNGSINVRRADIDTTNVHQRRAQRGNDAARPRVRHLFDALSDRRRANPIDLDYINGFAKKSEAETKQEMLDSVRPAEPARTAAPSMTLPWRYALLCAPLFGTVFLGYAIAKLPLWQARFSRIASKIVFGVLLPALLFYKLSDVASSPPVDSRLLLAFFGGCFIVFAIGRLVARALFRLDGVAQSVFALGGIFSNNVLLGLPLARSTLGAAAVPAAALVIVFNSLTLWTLVSVSIEWARHGAISLAGFTRTAVGVLTNPIVASILLGAAFSYSGLHLPDAAGAVLRALATVAGPAALLVLGMGLASHGMRSGLRESLVITALKLFVQPFVVWMHARSRCQPWNPRSSWCSRRCRSVRTST